MWLNRISKKLSKWRPPVAGSLSSFDPEMLKPEVLTTTMEIASLEIHDDPCRIDTKVCHFDLAIRPDSGVCIELISERETTGFRLIRSCLIGHTRNIHLLKNPRTRGHIFGSKEFGRSGPTFPCLSPHLGEAFNNPIAFSENRVPFDFQIVGANFLVQTQSSILADEMGLGKTVQAIIALRYLFQNAAIRTSLIICPKSILKTWERRLKEWAPELIAVVIEDTKDKRKRLWQLPAHVYLVGYETVSRDIRKKKDFDLLILDEIQKIKNPSTLIHKAVLCISAKRKWGLSGTPIENRVDELISLFSFMKPGLLSKQKKNPDIIKKRIRPHILRRRKIDVMPDLPPKLHNEVWLELTESQRVMYQETEQCGVDYLNHLGSTITVKHVLALITKLKLICNLNPTTNESSKLDFLKEKLNEIASDDKVLVFSQFPKMTLRHLKNEVKLDGLLYDGSISLKEREKIIDLFQNREEYRILFISLKSGGYGLNLTRANYVFHFDSWWNPATTAQAEDRVHRIGQEKPVFITYLYVQNTIEERIYKLINEKKALFDMIINDLSPGEIFSKLTKEEIFGLIMVRGDV